MNKLESYRIERGHSREFVAAFTGVSVTTIRNLERMGIQTPSIATLEKIKPYYGMTQAEILEAQKMEPTPEQLEMRACMDAGARWDDCQAWVRK